MRAEVLVSRAMRRWVLPTTLVVLAAAAAGCSSTDRDVYWQYGFRNNSARTLLLREEGPVWGSRIMLPHTSQQLDHVLEGTTLSVAVFDVECVGLGPVTLTQERPYLYVGEDSRIEAERPDVYQRQSPSNASLPNPRDLALVDVRVCSGESWRVDVRNDMGVDVLVRYYDEYSHHSEPASVPGRSRGELAAGSLLNHANDSPVDGLTAEVLGPDCGSLGTVALSSSRSVIYINVEGGVSAEPQSAFWEEPPAASYRQIRAEPSACDGAWTMASASP